MGFIPSENYSRDLSAWNGNWVSLGELKNILPEVWEEISAVKGLPVHTLKKAVPRSAIGSSGISLLRIKDGIMEADIDGTTMTGSAEFIGKDSLEIVVMDGYCSVRNRAGREVFRYMDFQSKQIENTSYHIYTYKLSGFPFEYATLTDIDINTEHTAASSFHASFGDEPGELFIPNEISTFFSDDDNLPQLLRSLFRVPSADK